MGERETGMGKREREKQLWERKIERDKSGKERERERETGMGEKDRKRQEWERERKIGRDGVGVTEREREREAWWERKIGID